MSPYSVGKRESRCCDDLSCDDLFHPRVAPKQQRFNALLGQRVPTVVLSAVIVVTAMVVMTFQGHRAHAAEVTLRFHHFLSELSFFHKSLAEPWKEEVERDSGGRIEVRIFPSMQLGGSAPQLYDQVRDGVVDIIWTLPSYTAGRFPIVTAFELPFMITNGVAASAALQEFSQTWLKDEFGDVHPLFFFTHARGSLHTVSKPVQTIEDLKGLKIRAPGAVQSQMLEALGAVPVGMPVNQVVPSLSRGVIDGAMLPFQVMTPLAIETLTPYTTEVEGEYGLYTATFVVAMNAERYRALPDDLRAVIDRHSGMAWAIRAGKAFEDAETNGRDVAVKRGNTFYTLPAAEEARWVEASSKVYDTWKANLAQKGIDAEAVLQQTRAVIKTYTQDPRILEALQKSEPR